MVNKAIDLSYIYVSSSKLVMENKLIKELECITDKKNEFTEVNKKQMIYWVMRFMKFHNHQHPLDLVQTDIESFLSSLATENQYNQKLQQSAEESIHFLYSELLKKPLNQLNYISIQQRKGYINYFGNNKCQQVKNYLSGKNLLMFELMLLGKLRLSEVVKLRDSDVDIKNNRINIFSEQLPKQDRTLLFTINIPLKLILDLRIQKMRIKQLFGFSNHTSKTKHSKITHNKNDFLFLSDNSLHNPEESIRGIKRCFKQDLKVAISQLNNKLKTSNHSKNKQHFQQLRMALNVSNQNRVSAPSNIKYKYNPNKKLQFELEVA